MDKVKAVAITSSQVLIAPWFSYWLSFLLSQSPFLALFSCLFAIPTAFYTSIEMIRRGKAYDLLQRSIHQFRGMFAFNLYTDLFSTIEYTTLWTICLIGGSSITYNYLYALIPRLTGLSVDSWERGLVFLFTVIIGSICVPVYSLTLNWILNDHSVKELEKKDYKAVLAGFQYERQVEAGGRTLVAPGKLSRTAQTVFWPSLILIATAVLTGLYVEPLVGSLVGLVAVHALFNLKLPTTTTGLCRWHVYAVALGLLLGVVVALVLTKNAPPLAVLLYITSILLLGLIAITVHPQGRELAPLYRKFIKGVAWGGVGVAWSLTGHNYPAFFSFLFSTGNLTTSVLPLVKRDA